jgi:hypothetical protein
MQESINCTTLEKVIGFKNAKIIYRIYDFLFNQRDSIDSSNKKNARTKK